MSEQRTARVAVEAWFSNELRKFKNTGEPTPELARATAAMTAFEPNAKHFGLSHDLAKLAKADRPDGLRVGRSNVAGRGLFATRMFDEGEVICEYTGPLIFGVPPMSNRYLFEIDDLWTIDGSPMSNIGRWANHDCHPNATADVDAHERRVWLTAKKTINPGDEITFHYGDGYIEDWFDGRCKCPACCRVER